MYVYVYFVRVNNVLCLHNIMLCLMRVIAEYLLSITLYDLIHFVYVNCK